MLISGLFQLFDEISHDREAFAQLALLAGIADADTARLFEAVAGGDQRAGIE